MSQLFNTPLFNDVNLVSYYKLEDTSDSKGANTLTNNNAVAFNNAKFGKGADTGTGNTNKYLGVAGNIAFAGNDPMSISFWVKRNNAGVPSETYVWHSSTTTQDRYFTVNYDGASIIFSASNGTDATYVWTTESTNFHHIVAVRDIAGAAIRMYFDGKLVSTGTIGTTTNSSNLFNIGSANGSNFSNSIIDDIGIFIRVLTQNEINMLFLAGGTNIAFEI